MHPSHCPQTPYQPPSLSPFNLNIDLGLSLFKQIYSIAFKHIFIQQREMLVMALEGTYSQ
jgi:hypothetical protein